MQEIWETRAWSLGMEDPLEEERATHSSILAWRIPWTEEPGGLQYTGLQRVGHNQSDLAHVHAQLLKAFLIAWLLEERPGQWCLTQKWDSYLESYKKRRTLLMLLCVILHLCKEREEGHARLNDFLLPYFHICLHSSICMLIFILIHFPRTTLDQSQM